MVIVKKQPPNPQKPKKVIKGHVKQKKAEDKGPVNKWAKFPPKECKQCDQPTHDIDRDSKDVPDVEPIFLHWTKMNTNSKGQQYPGGEECYACFGVRRRFFPNQDMKELKSSRKEQGA